MDRVSSIVNSFHDLWSLPVQIAIAFVLLYLQVDIAFFAGVIIIIGNFCVVVLVMCGCDDVMLQFFCSYDTNKQLYCKANWNCN